MEAYIDPTDLIVCLIFSSALHTSACKQTCQTSTQLLNKYEVSRLSTLVYCNDNPRVHLPPTSSMLVYYLNAQYLYQNKHGHGDTTK
jgi:hypothetical protein